MPYSATVRRFLISCPTDVPERDLQIIHRVISQWNVQYGPMFGAVVVPVSWSKNAAAEFGRPPQEAINDQLVDYCDAGIAVFANRFGTPIDAVSGTVEEIARLHEGGRYVGILRCRREVSPSTIDSAQFKRLEEYLESIRDKGLLLDYNSDSQLAERINTITVAAVAGDDARSKMQVERDEARYTVSESDVWPRVDSTERVETDSKGRVKTKRDRYIVLSNVGNAPAKNVRFSLEATGEGNSPWMVDRDSHGAEAPDVKILGPKSEARFAVISAMGTAIDVDCTVTWDSEEGPKSNEASLRLI